ncbi:metal-dependent hydrolase [Candidatus Babeliales bacterium]|nr:metal-dependent hydrolase [Candidatus Babeliales bacterium]
MPKYKAHLLTGLFLFIFFVILVIKFSIFNFNKNLLPVFLGFCLLGSLFPDIDTKSKIQKIIYSLLFLIILLLIFLQNWFALAILVIISFIPILVNHRALTHKKWFILLVPLVFTFFVLSFNMSIKHEALTSYLFFEIGALSHIYLDKIVTKYF